MHNAQHQMGEFTPLTKIGSFIASLFKGARDVATIQDVPVANPQNDENCAAGTVIYDQHDPRANEIDKVQSESQEQATDRLIAQEPLTPDRFKPSRHLFANWSQYKLIHTLFVRGEVSRKELGTLVDIANIPDLVGRMNRIGWAIRCQHKGDIDASGRCRYRGYYSLSENDHLRAWTKLYLVQNGY